MARSMPARAWVVIASKVLGRLVEIAFFMGQRRYRLRRQHLYQQKPGGQEAGCFGGVWNDLLRQRAAVKGDHDVINFFRCGAGFFDGTKDQYRPFRRANDAEGDASQDRFAPSGTAVGREGSHRMGVIG